MNQHKPYGLYEKYIKRPLDVFLATLAIIILSPVLLVTAILVRFKLGSPVLFTQERPGLDGKIFKLYKFRSMTDKKDRDGKLLPDDERSTSFGRTLRSTSFDGKVIIRATLKTLILQGFRRFCPTGKFPRFAPFWSLTDLERQLNSGHDRTPL